jgi:hypothetical protein
MEISNYIKEEAQGLLQAGTVLNLPMQLKSAPEFFLAAGDDHTVVAFSVIIHNGAQYKIGPKKAAA